MRRTVVLFVLFNSISLRRFEPCGPVQECVGNPRVSHLQLKRLCLSHRAPTEPKRTAKRYVQASAFHRSQSPMRSLQVMQGFIYQSFLAGCQVILTEHKLNWQLNSSCQNDFIGPPLPSKFLASLLQHGHNQQLLRPRTNKSLKHIPAKYQNYTNYTGIDPRYQLILKTEAPETKNETANSQIVHESF